MLNYVTTDRTIIYGRYHHHICTTHQFFAVVTEGCHQHYAALPTSFAVPHLEHDDAWCPMRVEAGPEEGR